MASVAPRFALHRLALVVALCHGAAMASPTDEEDLALAFGDQALIQLATGGALTLRRAPAVATVITARQIADMGASDLDQVLETVPGLHVNRAPGQYAPIYMIRGVHTPFNPQVLVLQNGVPVTTLYIGNKGNVWGGYPVEHIARIEIIRGPGSALHGSDAYAGVINIITKSKADTPGTEVGVRAGAFGTRAAHIQHGGKVGGADVAAFVRVAHTDGMRAVVEADSQTRNDTLFGTKASLAPGPVNTFVDSLDMNLEAGLGQWRLRAGAKVRDDMGTGAGIANGLDPVGRSRSERYTADLAWADQLFDKDWSVGAQLSTLQYVQLTPVDYQLLPPGLRLPTGLFPQGMRGGPDTWERQWRLSAFAAYSGWGGHQLRVGAGHDRLNLYRTREMRNFNYTAAGTPIPLPELADRTSTTPFLRPQLRHVNYVYLQDEWRMMRDWTMTAGVRHDRYSDFGDTTNPRLALVWDASLDVTAKFLYGRAFRAPSFLESYGLGNPVAIGNPLLSPETNGTLEAAVSWQASASLLLKANLYRYQMDDIIRAVPNLIAGTGSTYANTGGQDGSGLELEAIWNPMRALQINATLALQRSTDRATGLNAGYAPQRHAMLRAHWRLDGETHLGAQLNRVGTRQRAPGDARKPLAGYTGFDVSLRSSIGNGQWEWTATAHNLFNADIREPSAAPGLAFPFDLPQAPRALGVQLLRRW
jgi:outer membrane cobalamin receptor